MTNRTDPSRHDKPADGAREAAGAEPPPARPWVVPALWGLVASVAAGLLVWAFPAGAGWLLAAALAPLAGWAAWRHQAAVAVAAPAPVGDPAVDAAILNDPRTGMFHRAAFLALAERDWLRAGRYGGAVGLLLVEVDRLRAMTDRSGPGVADALLAGLGQQVGASLRAADLLARFDAAQLAIFLPQSDPTGALDVAERVRESVLKLRIPGLPEGAEFTASVGVAVLRPLHQPLSTLVSGAHQALLAARRAGGNCVRLGPADAVTPGASGADDPTRRRSARGDNH